MTGRLYNGMGEKDSQSEPDAQSRNLKEDLRMKASNQVNVLLELYRLEVSDDGVGGTRAFQMLAERLDPSLLARYHKLRERKGTAVAVLENGACSGCKILYPETHEILRHKNFVHSCEYCGRFLLVAHKPL